MQNRMIRELNAAARVRALSKRLGLLDLEGRRLVHEGALTLYSTRERRGTIEAFLFHDSFVIRKIQGKGLVEVVKEYPLQGGRITGAGSDTLQLVLQRGDNLRPKTFEFVFTSREEQLDWLSHIASAIDELRDTETTALGPLSTSAAPRRRSRRTSIAGLTLPSMPLSPRLYRAAAAAASGEGSPRGVHMSNNVQSTARMERGRRRRSVSLFRQLDADNNSPKEHVLRRASLNLTALLGKK